MTQERLNKDFRKIQSLNANHQIDGTLEEPPIEIKVPDKVCVVHGANQKYFNLAGLTISEVKLKLRDAINVASSAEAHVEGKLVDESYLLKGGEHLEFVKEAGVKGIL